MCPGDLGSVYFLVWWWVDSCQVWNVLPSLVSENPHLLIFGHRDVSPCLLSLFPAEVAEEKKYCLHWRGFSKPLPWPPFSSALFNWSSNACSRACEPRPDSWVEGDVVGDVHLFPFTELLLVYASGQGEMRDPMYRHYTITEMNHTPEWYWRSTPVIHTALVYFVTHWKADCGS